MTVTFLFSDIELSTDLLRRVGDDVFAAIRADHRRLLRETFRSHRGTEVDTAGDGFFVAFGSARDAVLAAISAQRALAGHAWPGGAAVKVRMGLHTTEPHPTADNGYVGLGVHRASRICDAANGGQILVSGATAGIVEDAEPDGVELLDLGEHRLKGLPRPQRVFEVTAPGVPASERRLRTAHRSGVGTFFITDLTGWREVIRSRGDEASTTIMFGYHASVAAVVDAHHGFTLERAGDNVLGVFPNASDAVRAVAAVRRTLDGTELPPVRITVHSGRWSGDPLRPAASTALMRLMLLTRATRPGQVLVSQTTAALVEGDRSLPALRDLGEREVPEIDGRTRLYELD